MFLPGVGTARAAMAELEKRELPDLIRSLTQPVLGICLGEQLLAKRSEETGGVDMLGLIPAEVRELRVGSLPLPHMGWNRVFPDDSPMPNTANPSRRQRPETTLRAFSFTRNVPARRAPDFSPISSELNGDHSSNRSS